MKFRRGLDFFPLLVLCNFSELFFKFFSELFFIAGLFGDGNFF